MSGDFRTDPEPFGSTFRFIFTTPQEYNFVHLINSSSICISFGDRGYVVFIGDGQVLKNTVGREIKEIEKKDKIELVDMLFFYAKNIEYMERYKITIPVMVSPGKIVKTGPAVARTNKPVDKELLQALCARLGFTWVESPAK